MTTWLKEHSILTCKQICYKLLTQIQKFFQKTNEVEKF